MMNRYSEERKQSVLAKLLPPHNQSVAEVARTEGIGLQTLYNWRNDAKQRGIPVPGYTPSSDTWSAESKLATVIECAALSESELSQYCRQRGLYPEQVHQWKADMLDGMSQSKAARQAADQQQRQDRKELKTLKKELRRKDRALAETTALLVLQKKLDALWQQENEDE